MKEWALNSIRKLHLTINLLVIMTLLLPNSVLAASPTSQRQPLAGAGLFITLAIVYLSRRRAIGGWLLYFYIQLYLGLAVSLFFVSQALSNLNPANWDNSMLYVMFFLSVVPAVVTQGVEVFSATKLLFRRNERNLTFLRRTLIALVVTSGIGGAIDIAFFEDVPSLFLDMLTFVFAIIWTLYFYKARRVRRVFIDRNWVYEPRPARKALTPDDKRKLRKRSLIAALIVFVLFLLITGLSLKDEQPDIKIFLVPLLYAFIAAIVAWYLPLRKKKAPASQKAAFEGEANQNKT